MYRAPVRTVRVDEAFVPRDRQVVSTTTDSDRTVRLPDGRDLAYAQHGSATGLPLLVFHGLPGSRLDLGMPGVDNALRERGMRALVIDRPGMGRSTPLPERRLLDWPADVVGFADAVGIDRFAVLGFSAGAPYALACADRCGERILAAGVVAASAPLDAAELAPVLGPEARWTHRWARWFPRRLKGSVRAQAAQLAAPGVGADELLPALAEADRAILADPEVGGAWLASWREGFRQGEDGPWWDLVVASRPWGFTLSEIELPIQLWFGAEDRQTPPGIGRYLANALRRSEARLYSHEGHFSLLAGRWAEILDGVATAVGRAAHRS